MHTNEYVREPSLFTALNTLCGDLNGVDFRDSVAGPSTVPTHPFGLEPLYAGPTRYFVPAPIDDTKMSVDVMAACVRYVLSVLRPGAPLPRFRIITAEDREEGRSYYFEFAMMWFTCIAGGCTNCSEEGGEGTHRLWSLFSHIANMLEVEIEEVYVPAPQARDYTTALRVPELAWSGWSTRMCAVSTT